jgi:pyrroline-5-carboxylate reductase
MMLDDARIAFIGSGAMGEAIIKGLLANGLVRPQQIVAADPVAARREHVTREYGVTATDNNPQAVDGATIVVLSVKPQVTGQAFPGLRSNIPAAGLVLSIMAGVPVAAMREGLQHGAIVRSMPNTPAQVGKGMTVWMATPEVTQAQREQAALVLGALGEQIAVNDEHYLDMATGLSGSGPGFVYLLIEALIDAGVQIGFSRADSQKLVLQTIDGSVELMRQSGQHPAELRNRVTSPAGTTGAGLFELEAGGVRTAIMRAVQAAYQRSVDLGVAQNEAKVK